MTDSEILLPNDTITTDTSVPINPDGDQGSNNQKIVPSKFNGF